MVLPQLFFEKSSFSIWQHPPSSVSHLTAKGTLETMRVSLEGGVSQKVMWPRPQTALLLPCMYAMLDTNVGFGQVNPGGLDPRISCTSSTRLIHCAITSDDQGVYFPIIYCVVERNSLNSILTAPGLGFESHAGWRGFESQWGICTL